MLINNIKYEEIASNGNLQILKNKNKYFLYNIASQKFELENFENLAFEYTTPLLSKEFKNYDKEQLSIIKVKKNGKNGLLSIHREDGTNVSSITNPIPIEYDMVQIVMRGRNTDINSPKFNQKCIVYVGNNNKYGLYVFNAQNNENMNGKKNTFYQVPCCFDEVCEYYNGSSRYFKWWMAQEESDLKYFYVIKDKKCGVYNALEGRYEVEPKFEQISPNNYSICYKASKGKNDYIIIDGEEYIPKNSVISKMIIQNESQRKKELEKLLLLDETEQKDYHF